jgi:predicted Zn finger-like uncharacterized protein
MRHTCEHCATRYEIPDAKVSGRFLKVRCKACANTMHVVGIEARTSGDAVWWVAIGGLPMGPYTEGEIRELIELGDIHGRSRMWAQGMPGWQRVCETDVLAWVYGEILAYAGSDPAMWKSPSSVFDRAALLSDGHGYFPDPTLKSGIIILDEQTQAGLRALFQKSQKTRATGTSAARPSLAPSFAAAAVGACAAAAGIAWMVLEQLA